MHKEINTIVNLLQQKGVKIEAGLTKAEIKNLESIYEVVFPEDWKQFFQFCLPCSSGFYNWRNTSPEYVSYIKKIIEYPVQSILSSLEEIVWNNSWGDEPQNIIEKQYKLKRILFEAPTLIPIYSHRYLPVIATNHPPVLSIHGIDIIYYGENLSDYFQVEFGEKKQNEIAFSKVDNVPFWTDELY